MSSRSLPICSLIAMGLALCGSGCGLQGQTKRGNEQTDTKDVAVVPEMLIGARYQGRTGGTRYDDLSWAFGKSRFRIVAGEAGWPEDLSEALLPDGATVHRVDGRWSVGGEVLTLTDLEVDGRKTEQLPKNFWIRYDGVIKIQPAADAYEFERGTPELIWHEGKIPEWPPGTTRVTGALTFPEDADGWLTVGYRGHPVAEKSLSGSVTSRITPDHNRGFAVSPSDKPRHARLQYDVKGHATVRYMAVPPGTYLFYAKWKPPDPRVLEGKGVAGFFRFRLTDRFAAKWVVVTDRPLARVDFNLRESPGGAIEIHAPARVAYQSVFLLPWGEADADPPPLDADSAWTTAWWAGRQSLLDSGKGGFEDLPVGRYRLFLTEHEQPAKDEDTRDVYEVIGDRTVAVRADAPAKVSF